MPRFTTRLLSRAEIAEGTMTFAFERPAGFEFIAGQNLTFTLPQPLYTDEKGASRTFTVASPPQEHDRLVVATRMTGSAFKRSLADMPLGGPINVFGPAGDFVLPGRAFAPIVFVAGGIGITPFRSMILDATSRPLAHRITLLYANRAPAGAAFHAEFERLASQDRTLRYLPTMTQAGDVQPPWRGEMRAFTAALLAELLGDLSKPIFYLAGPPGLVTALSAALSAAGVTPDRLHVEEFGGYAPRPALAETPPAAPAPPSPASAQPAAQFVRVASATDLRPGQVIGVEAKGISVALCNVDGAFYAVSDECPHALALLSEGDLEGKELSCPRHGAIFDVTTGAVLTPPADEAVTCYQVRVVRGGVEVAV